MWRIRGNLLLLMVSRIESGQMPIELSQVNAGALLQTCQEMMQAQANQAGVRLLLQVASGLRPVLADPTRLRQVLLNLISNGIKYNRPGGEVRIVLHREGEHLRFLVQDTGLGMTRAQRQHLFEPFNRLGRDKGSVPGAGIGLVICQQLLGLMGSQLHVCSEAGQGSTFSFDLPLNPSI